MRRFLIVALLLVLAGCASTPHHTGNLCSVFAQKNGWFHSWQGDAERASTEYGVPVPILMATIYTESGYEARAKPPRRWVLGFIPWGRTSSAYGYAQAIDGTWSHYQRATGAWGASRRDFSDAVRFVAWYHQQSHVRNGIPLDDPYNLYLAYYAGHDGYARGVWRSDPGMRAAAARMAKMARTYAYQLGSCR